MESRQARHDRFVISITAVAVQLDKVGKQQSDEVLRVRALRMPRNLRALPGPKMSIKLAPQLRDFPPQPLKFRVGVGVAGKLSQLFDIFLEAVNGAFPLADSRRFFGLVPSRHHITSSIACSPQICRTDSISSGLMVTHSLACTSATEPSGECNSNNTGLVPGAPAKSSSSRSRVPSSSDCISSRTRNSGG